MRFIRLAMAIALGAIMPVSVATGCAQCGDSAADCAGGISWDGRFYQGVRKDRKADLGESFDGAVIPACNDGSGSGCDSDEEVTVWEVIDKDPETLIATRKQGAIYIYRVFQPKSSP